MLLVTVLMAVVFLLGLHIVTGALMGVARGREPSRSTPGWLLLGTGLCLASAAEFVPPGRAVVVVRTAGIVLAAAGMIVQRGRSRARRPE